MNTLNALGSSNKVKVIMKIGIFGGSFDPVHNEHVNMAMMAKEELQLDRLYIIPAKISPFKRARKVTSSKDRLAMLNLAFLDKDVVISEYELSKVGVSYTCDTILQFRKFFPKDKLYFIMGGDSIASFKKWKNPEVIAKNAEIAVIARGGNYVSLKNEEKEFKKHFGKNFIKLNYVGKEVSATKIRLLSLFGLPLDGYVPKAVEDYIKEHSLYKDNPYMNYLKEVMTESRLIHTANVVTVALSKAEQEGLDSNKVLLTAVLHDIAKNIDPDTVEGFTYKGIPKQVVHAYLGAYIMETKLGITDTEVLNAVRYHTTATVPMSKLAKLIFCADMVEEDRTYEGVERLREIFHTKDIDTAFKECLKEEIEHLKQKGYELFGETKNAYEYYIKYNNV